MFFFPANDKPFVHYGVDLNIITKALLLLFIFTSLSFGQGQKVEKHTPFVTALFNRMLVQPHDTVKTAISKFIKGLVDSALWNKFDCLYILAASDAYNAKLNWIKDNYNLTAVGNMSFEQFRGYMGDGGRSYLETNYDPLTDGVNYLLNSCGTGIYSRTDSYILGDKADMGSGENPPYIWINFKGTRNGLIRPYLNSTTSSGSIYNYTGSTLGIITVNRTAPDTVSVFTTTSTGSTQRISNANSVAIPNQTIWISGRNDGKKGTAFQSRQYAAAFIGGPLSQREHEIFTKFLEAYLDAVGAGVIP